MKRKLKILLISNCNVTEKIRAYIENTDHIIKQIEDIYNIKKILKEYFPDIILLDKDIITLDIGTVINIIEEETVYIRKKVPIIVSSYNDELINKVLAMELGADDYITKPVDLRELSARINAITRRYDTSKNDMEIMKFGNLLINADSFEVTYRKKIIKLTSVEFKILLYLANNKNNVLSRDDILLEIWGDNHSIYYRNIDVHISKLKEKFKEVNSIKIDTVWGIGYRLTQNK